MRQMAYQPSVDLNRQLRHLRRRWHACSHHMTELAITPLKVACGSSQTRHKMHVSERGLETRRLDPRQLVKLKKFDRRRSLYLAANLALRQFN